MKVQRPSVDLNDPSAAPVGEDSSQITGAASAGQGKTTTLPSSVTNLSLPGISAVQSSSNPSAFAVPKLPTDDKVLSFTDTPIIPQAVPVVKRASYGSKKVLLSIIAIFLFLFAGTSSALAAIAYGTLSVNNPQVEQVIRHIVMSIPYTPKTAQYVIESAVLAQNNVKKEGFDLSLSAKSNELASTLGMNEFDMDVQGHIDTTNAKYSKLQLTATVPNFLTMEMRDTGQTMYLKLNKVPDLLLTSLQLDPTKLQPVLSKWVKIDESGFTSPSSQLLNTNGSSSNGNKLINFYNQKVIPAMQLSTDTVNGVEMYRLHLVPSKDMIDQFFRLTDSLSQAQTPSVNTASLTVTQTNPSDYIKNVEIDIWVNKQSFVIERSSAQMSFQSTAIPSLPTQVLGASTILSRTNLFGTLSSTAQTVTSSEVNIAAVANFSDYNKDFVVDVPTDYLNSTEYLQQLESSSSLITAGQPSSKR